MSLQKTSTGEIKIKKSNFRCNAHCSSFKSTGLYTPNSPSEVKWSNYYTNGEPPKILDIGCGYGRFLFRVGVLLNQTSSTEGNIITNVLGIEIRKKVSEFVELKINQVRSHSDDPKHWGNIGVMNANALLFLPNIVHKHSIDKIFILYPDPHFKKSKQKGRIVCPQMMAIFEYILSNTGEIYISTDVKDLYEDMRTVLLESGIFEEKKQIHEKLTEDTTVNEKDMFELSYKGTDESTRAGVKTGEVYASIFAKKQPGV